MTLKIHNLLTTGTKLLEGNNSILTPQLDARLILQNTLHMTHEDLFLNKNQSINKKHSAEFFDKINRRLKNEPVAYILGYKEFFGKDFIVSEHTLIPRPDTEILIETSMKLFHRENNIKILDIGTGSGCIAITLANYFRNAKLYATDASADALKVAQQNAINHHTKITFILDTNFAASLDKKFDLIISNPPYIDGTDLTMLAEDVKNYEPKLALYGGKDGLDAYRVIARQAQNLLATHGFLLVEIGINQKEDVTKIFKKHGFTLQKFVKDLSGIERALCFILSDSSE